MGVLHAGKGPAANPLSAALLHHLFDHLPRPPSPKFGPKNRPYEHSIPIWHIWYRISLWFLICGIDGIEYMVCIVHDRIRTQGSYKPWFLESPLSWPLEPECRILAFSTFTLTSKVPKIMAQYPRTESIGRLPRPPNVPLLRILVPLLGDI